MKIKEFIFQLCADYFSFLIFHFSLSPVTSSLPFVFFAEKSHNTNKFQDWINDEFY